MPYIKSEKREFLDPVITSLHEALVELQVDDEFNNMEGNINYTITRLLMMVYGDKDSTNYSQINDAMGVLSCIQAEYYRKVAAPYEDQKEFENGQVERFKDSTPIVVGTVNVNAYGDVYDNVALDYLKE